MVGVERCGDAGQPVFWADDAATGVRVGLRKPRAGYAASRVCHDAVIAEALCLFFSCGARRRRLTDEHDPPETVSARKPTDIKFSTLLLRRRRRRVALALQHHGPVDLGDVRQSPQDFNFGFCRFQPFVHGVAHQ